MRALKLRKNWFTLVEVILVTSVFAIVVVWIILAINRSFIFIDNTRLSVRAANFAREWMEMMYNLRDTNWRKHSWNRDKYWLSVWEWNSKFEKWIYILKEGKIDPDCSESKSCGKYIYAQKLNNTTAPQCNDDKFYSDSFWDSDCDSFRNKAKLSFTWEYSYYELEEGEEVLNTWSIQDVLIWEWLEFYRIVRVFGIYKKDVENEITEVSNVQLEDWTPAEMRFCVKVFYRSTGKHSTELCGIMTNFME